MDMGTQCRCLAADAVKASRTLRTTVFLNRVDGMLDAFAARPVVLISALARTRLSLLKKDFLSAVDASMLRSRFHVDIVVCRSSRR